jgi:hypothetical protein
MVIETLKGLRLDVPKAHAPGNAQAPAFDYKRLERLLSTFMGPQPS